MDAIYVNARMQMRNALDFTSQAGDLKTSVLSKQISKDMIWLKIKWMILRQPLTSQGQL